MGLHTALVSKGLPSAHGVKDSLSTSDKGDRVIECFGEKTALECNRRFPIETIVFLIWFTIIRATLKIKCFNRNKVGNHLP